RRRPTALQKPPRMNIRRVITFRLGTGLATGVSTAIERAATGATAEVACADDPAPTLSASASNQHPSSAYPGSTLISQGQISACPWRRKKQPTSDSTR